MTNEDKKIVADYMKWIFSEYGGDYYYIPKNGKVIYFDPYDAALCVAEMQKRGDWEQFHDFVIEWGDLLSKASFAYITAWLMTMEEGQAKNFFKAFVEWRKGK
jgi:hypothetical protein